MHRLDSSPIGLGSGRSLPLKFVLEACAVGQLVNERESHVQENRSSDSTYHAVLISAGFRVKPDRRDELVAERALISRCFGAVLGVLE